MSECVHVFCKQSALTCNTLLSPDTLHCSTRAPCKVPVAVKVLGFEATVAVVVYRDKLAKWVRRVARWQQAERGSNPLASEAAHLNAKSFRQRTVQSDIERYC